MSEETTTEQLAEIEGQGTEYTPPDGYRVLQVGEVIQRDDIFLAVNGEHWPAKRIGEKVNNNRYIRRIEVENCGFEGKILCEVSQSCAPCDSRDTCDTTTSEQLAEIEGQPQPLQVREGRWRTRRGDIKNIRPCEPLQGAHFVWPWTDGIMTFQDNGRHQGSQESAHDLIEYLGPIEQQPQPQPQPQPHAAAIEELRSEVSYVQRLLGESRQRVTQLEDLVASLRTINEAQEKAFNAASKANDDLQHRLNVVAAEWAEQAETIRRLQIELGAAQQVPQAIADRFEEGWNQGTARAVETVLEWLEPIRAVDNEHLANEALQHLPQIMRHLTGLAQD